MNRGNCKRLKLVAATLARLAKANDKSPEVLALVLLDAQRDLLTIQQDLLFRPDANRSDGEKGTPR